MKQADDSLYQQYQARLAPSPQLLHESSSGHIVVLDMPQLDISATDIRSRAAQIKICAICYRTQLHITFKLISYIKHAHSRRKTKAIVDALEEIKGNDIVVIDTSKKARCLIAWLLRVPTPIARHARWLTMW